MKLVVLKAGDYALRWSGFRDVHIDAGTIFETEDYEIIGSNIRYFIQHEGETVVLYDDEVQVYPSPEADKVEQMRQAKFLSLKKQKEVMENLPNKNDSVLYTVSNLAGNVTGSHSGVVMDMNFVSAYHVLIKIREDFTGAIHELVIGHPKGWYSGDKIERVSKERPSSFTYYGIHDSREDKIRLDSLNVYREDTENYLRSVVGTPVPPYLKVRKLKVQFDD